MSAPVLHAGPVEKPDSGHPLVRAAIGGSFGSDEVMTVKSWADNLHKLIADSSGGAKDSVDVLIDISALETYSDPELILILTNLMKNDNPFVHRTATWGGTPLHEMIERVIRGLTGRNNLKNFKTEKEAREWLGE